MLQLANDPKKINKAKKAQEKLLKLEKILEKWQSIQEEIDAHRSGLALTTSTEVDLNRAQPAANVVQPDTDSERNEPPSQMPSQSLALIPFNSQANGAASISNVPMTPKQPLHPTESDQALQLLHPQITEESGQLVRFALKALAETLPLPPSAEHTHFCLL